MNSAKSWQLGWYPSRSLSLDLANQGPFTGDLIGIVDYQNAGADGKYVTVQVVPPIPGAIPIFVGFNLDAGFNSDTQEGQNQVTVTSQPGNGYSSLRAKLSSGGQFTLNNFWYSAPLVIKVNTLSTAGSPSTANVKISLNGCTSNADCKDGNACLVGTCGTYGTCSYSHAACPGTFVMDLTTDNWPEETSWKVQDMCNGGAVVQSGGAYVSKSKRYTNSKTLGKSWYKVTFLDSYGDGLGGSPNGSFKATLDGLPVAVGEGDFGFQISGEFGIPCGQLAFFDDFQNTVTAFKCASSTECKIASIGYGSTKSLELNAGKTTSNAYTFGNYDVSTSTSLRVSFVYYTQSLVSGDKFYVEYKSNINANWATVATFTYGTAPLTSNKVWRPAAVEWSRGSESWVSLRVRSAFSTNKKKVNFDNFALERL